MNKHFKEKKWHLKNHFMQSSERYEDGIKNKEYKVPKKKSWSPRKKDFLFEEDDEEEYS